jgi:DnaJ-class molecular chaperone
MNPYQVLGVDRSADENTIKKAYRKLAAQHHPDRGGDTAKFQEIQGAYDILSDPQKRHEFDNPRPHFNGGNFGQPGGFDFHFDFGGGGIHDIFEHIRAGQDPFAQMRQPRRNRDIRSTIVIPLAETLTDQLKILTIGDSNNKSRDLEMRIPKGVTTGTTFRFAQQGDHQIPNFPPGDLLVTVNVQAHPDFEVHGLDLTKCLKIDSWDAMIGCEREVTGLDGRKFSLKIPEGVQWGSKLRVSGEGLWAFQKDIKGNLLVRIEIETPRNLSEEQKTFVKNLKLRT